MLIGTAENRTVAEEQQAVLLIWFGVRATKKISFNLPSLLLILGQIHKEGTAADGSTMN